MKNKVFTVRIFTGKSVRIIFAEKLQTYFIEVNDLKKLFELNKKDIPEKYQNRLNYIGIKKAGVVKKLACVAEEDLEIIKNFSKSKNADNYYNSLLTIIEDIKLSYSGYTKGMVLPQEAQDNLINDLEKKARKINILEG